ncbi:MAG: flagellar FliJ family protein [Rhodothermales bacterium]
MLRLRAHETECARQDLGTIREQLREQETRIEMALAYLDELSLKKVSGSVGQRSLSRSDAFRREAQERLDEERRRLAHLKELEEDARLRLVEKKGAEEAIHRLREQEEERYWKTYNSVETGILDEQAIAGYTRRKRAANS